jgi:hypothetical protein
VVADADTAGRPMLRAMIEAILAFDHPAFPAIAIERVEQRLLECFPLTGERGAALWAGLAAFDRAFAEAAGGGRFATATLDARRAALRRWAQSDVPEQRRFYASMKRLVLIPAYALPELRRAVGAAQEGEPT